MVCCGVAFASDAVDDVNQDNSLDDGVHIFHSIDDGSDDDSDDWDDDGSDDDDSDDSDDSDD